MTDAPEDQRIFLYWRRQFERFIASSEEWNYDDIDGLEGDPRLPDGKASKGVMAFCKKLQKLAQSYGVDFRRGKISIESPFNRESNPFGKGRSEWYFPGGAVEKLHEALQACKEHSRTLRAYSEMGKKPSGPRRRLPPETAKAILIGLRALKFDKKGRNEMKKFLSPAGRFEQLAKERNPEIKPFLRRIDESESLDRWLEGAQDRCIEAILSAKMNKPVKESMKNKVAKRKLLDSMDSVARKMINQAKRIEK